MLAWTITLFFSSVYLPCVLINSYTLIQKNKNLSNTFQIHVLATDNGYLPRTSSNNARVQVIVTRNRMAPKFTRPEYVAEVEETKGPGSKVLDMTARDEDPSVCSHSYIFD